MGDTPGAVTRVRLDYDVRRRQILAAARRLFAARDYPSVSTQDIASAAGVTRGLVHHYFRSKRDLYLEVVRDMLQVPELPRIADGGGDPARVWAASVDRWLDLMEANRDSWLAAIRAGEAGDDPALRRILDEASEVMAERVIEALGLTDGVAPAELRAVVRAYGGLAQEATREWLERGRLSRDQVRVLLAGAMPLIAEHLVPAVVTAGTRRRRAGRA